MTLDSNSQACQDLFVLKNCNFMRGGYYVEIGADHPTKRSNTFLLENTFGWHGFSIEVDQVKTDYFNACRINKCFLSNALTFKFKKHMNLNRFPKHFEYLQIDIDPPVANLIVLLKFPFYKYRPRVITFEHDKYRLKFNIFLQYSAFLYLKIYNYKRVVKDVNLPNKKGFKKPFEDWYLLVN